MKVLVAAVPTQRRRNDYSYLTTGELVYVQEPCATDMNNPEGGCGCGRGFAGMSSHRAGVAAKVVETELTLAEVREALRSSMEAGGWLDRAWVSEEEADDIVDAHLAVITDLAEYFPMGAVIRRRIWDFFVDELHAEAL